MEFLFGFGGFFFPFGFLLLGAVVLAAIAIVGRRTTPEGVTAPQAEDVGQPTPPTQDSG